MNLLDINEELKTKNEQQSKNCIYIIKYFRNL